MTTQNFIDKNKTDTLKKGDKVVMYGCYEATVERYKDRIWTCLTDSYMDRASQEVVFLEGFGGCFAVQYLKRVVLIVSSRGDFEDAVFLFQNFKPVKVDKLLKDEFNNFVSKHFMLMGIERWSATIYPLKKSYKFLRKS